MSLIKSSLLNGISVIVRMLSMLGINKVLAIYVGPSGYAVVGQFYNAVQLITNFASGAINVGVVKYTAEYSEDFQKQKEIWKTAGTIALFGSLIVSILIFIFRLELAHYFLHDNSLAGVFVWFAASLTLFVFNTLLLAILNGRKELKSFVVANIIGSLFSLLFTVWLTKSFQLFGALVGLGTFQAVAFFATLFICKTKSWFSIRDLVGAFNKGHAFNLSKYTLMSLTTAVCVPASQILIRNFLGKHYGWASAGYWEAMWKLSSAYMLVVTTTLSVYYLPRMSELKDSDKVRSEIWNCFRIVVPFSIFTSISIFVLKDYVISLLFTPDFFAMKPLFFWQMIGDTLKISSWILAFVFLGKGMTKHYVFSEVVFTFSYYYIIVLLSPYYEFESVSLAHAINYAFYLAYVYWALRRKGFVK